MPADDMKKTRIKCPLHLGKATLPEATWRPVKKKMKFIYHIYTVMSLHFDQSCAEEWWAATVQHPGGPDPDLPACIWSGKLIG